MPDLSKLYRHRFEQARREEKIAIWGAILDSYLQRIIGKDRIVMDLASGYGEFSHHVKCKELICVDLNPDAKKYLPEASEFHNVSALEMSQHIGQNRADVVFTSNFLEHLHTKEECDQVLREVFEILKPGGQFIVMGPNLRYVKEEYWDFYDHYLPLTHLSLEEGLIQAGYKISFSIPKFLPYTTKSRLPTNPSLVRLYLRVPLAWNFLGKQFLVGGVKEAQLS